MFNRRVMAAAMMREGYSAWQINSQLAKIEEVEVVRHRNTWYGRKERPYPVSNSIAGGDHKHEQEIARRARQAERRAANRLSRAKKFAPRLFADGIGLSRSRLPIEPCAI